MGAHPSDTIMLLKQDIEKGIVKKVIHDDLLEYWVYQCANSAKMDTNGKLVTSAEPLEETPKVLRFIIVCENKPEHIQCEHVNNIVVSGIRFSDDDKGFDMKDYLDKTGRTL